jgi:DNA-binding response OmpR family regulator
MSIDRLGHPRFEQSSFGQNTLGTVVAYIGAMYTNPIPFRRKCILIVDDEPDCGDILAQFLGAQYDVVVARDGIEGIEQARKHPPDLIISDVAMPRLGGFAMVRHIRTRQCLKAPVIFLTASPTSNDFIEGISAGARPYHAKPLQLNELQKRVARALES